MAIIRSALLRASRSPWLAEQFRNRSFAQRAVRQFMPGEDVQTALAAAATLAGVDIGSVLTALGERVTTREEADAVRDQYLAVLDMIRASTLGTHISVKLTHLGLDVDAARCAESVEALASRGAAVGTTVWIDMEESPYVDATLDIYEQIRSEHGNVGICLQAYLRRTPADLESVLRAGGSVRLVKGAYRESPAMALQRKSETDAAYFALARQMLTAAGNGRPQVFGTHDVAIVHRVGALAASLRVPSGAWEVHMLYGIRARDQRTLAAEGLTMRVLISYGTHWFPWYVRRLAERPANMWFLARSVLD